MYSKWCPRNHTHRRNQPSSMHWMSWSDSCWKSNRDWSACHPARSEPSDSGTMSTRHCRLQGNRSDWASIRPVRPKQPPAMCRFDSFPDSRRRGFVRRNSRGTPSSRNSSSTHRRLACRRGRSCNHRYMNSDHRSLQNRESFQRKRNAWPCQSLYVGTLRNSKSCHLKGRPRNE